MVCYNDFAVNFAESLLIFYFEDSSSPEIKITKKDSESMRNVSTGNNSKVFLVQSKESDKWENKNCKNYSANTEINDGTNLRKTAESICENILDFWQFALVTYFLFAHKTNPF